MVCETRGKAEQKAEKLNILLNFKRLKNAHF